jgi:dihydrofolate reductase
VVDAVTRVIVGYTTSIDGFVADEQGGVGRLYADLADLQDKPYMKDLIADTGAVVMGRHTFEMGDPDTYADNYEFQVPIFIVTHHPPERHPRENGRISYTFVTEGVEPAVRMAKAAAKDRNVVVVGGANLVGQLFAANLVDELHVDVMPVLLGGGQRFWGPGLEHLRLEMIDVSRKGARTTLKYRVIR